MDREQAVEWGYRFVSYGIMVPYMVGWGLAVPLYNYVYARTHGFLAWLFFGEIVASFQAALWPYDLYRFLAG